MHQHHRHRHRVIYFLLCSGVMAAGYRKTRANFKILDGNAKKMSSPKDEVEQAKGDTVPRAAYRP